jgi:hypothetical protein
MLTIILLLIGIATNFNYLSSICWTTVLAYEIYCIVKFNVGIKSLTNFHYICWILPLTVTLLPLSTNTYANPVDGSGWCFIGERADSPSWGLTFWVIMSFYFWVWLCIAITSYLYINTMIHFYQAQLYKDTEMSRTITMLSLYPVLLIVCWTLTSVVDISSTLSRPNGSLVSGVFGAFALILPALQGFIHTSIFVLRSKVIRETWRDFYYERKFQLIFYHDVGFGRHYSNVDGNSHSSILKSTELQSVINVLHEDENPL